MTFRHLGVVLSMALVAGCVSPLSQDGDLNSTTITSTSPPAPTTAAEAGPFQVLVFHKTSGFRHQSIPAGIEAMRELGDESGFEVLATEDASLFTASELESFEVVVFLNTTGDILDEEQEAAMEAFVRSGKGFVGVHSAADTEYDWSWYGSLVGAYFDNHPAPQSAVFRVLDPGSHPVIAGLEPEIERFDEWYNFRSLPPPGAEVLAVIDESTYDGGTMGDPHPIIWAQEIDGGRSVYTGFGHTVESYEEPVMRVLLTNSIRWAAARLVGDG